MVHVSSWARAGLVAVAAMVAVTSVLPVLAANDEMAQVLIGATTTVQLDGNPSTGYSWSYDAAASEGADLVSVEDAGSSGPALEPGQRPVLGAPKKQSFRVTGVAEGAAKLVFRYARAGGEAEKTQEIVVEVITPSE